MKTIFRRSQKGAAFRSFSRILPAGLLAAFLVIAVLLTAVRVAAKDVEPDMPRQQLAQETGGYWQLVDTIVEPVSEERITDSGLDTHDLSHAYAEEVKYGELCGTATNTLSDGSFVFQRKYFKSEHCYKQDYYFTAVATWSQPPERITPGKPLTLQANISKATSITSSTSSWFYCGTGLSISTDEPDVGCGSTRAGKGVCSMRVSAPTSEGHVEEKEDCVLEVGAGSSAGDQFALRYCTHAGGYRYVYEWVPAEEKPAAPGPAEVEEPKPEQPKPDPPKADDSEPDTGYQRPSSSDSGSGGSVLGPLAVLGTLGTLGVGVMGGLAVLGGAGAIAIGIKVLGGGGGAAASSVTVGKPYVGDKVAEQVADVVEPTEEKLDLKDKPPEITRENLENEIQKELERLAEEGHYIGNKTILQKGLNIGASSWISDKVFGRTKNYCEEMKDLGKAHLEKIMPEGTIIEHVALQRNRLMNHIANRVILPDGTELVIDYWEGLANNKPAVYTVKEWKEKWKKELGEPMHGRYEIDDVVSQGQKMMFDHVIKNGYDKIDEFSPSTLTPKEVETIKNWARREDWESYETWDNVRNGMTHEEWDDWKTVYLYKKRLGVVPKISGGAR